MKYPNIISLLLLVIATVSCQDQKSKDAQSEYIKEVKAWRVTRLTSLKEDWLPLVALYWLEDGLNTFGSDSTNNLVFPSDFPPFFGSFQVSPSAVMVGFTSEETVATEGVNIREILIDLKASKPQVFSFKTYEWWVIERAGRYAVRVKDQNSPVLYAFQDLSNYPIDPNWQLEAIFTPYVPPKMVSMQDVLGLDRETEAPGFISFTLAGQAYQLDVLPEGFVIFADDTNGKTTYGAGRYVYIDLPSEAGETVIDFNKAYSPPCAFTEFATCPLPPRQNVLSVSIPAGEKYEYSY